VITKASLGGIYVTDQQRALDFYTEKLGFEVRTDAPMDMGPGTPAGVRWLEVAPKGAETSFTLFTPPGMESRVGGFSNLVFGCDDVQKTVEDLRATGVEISEEPHEAPWGGWWAQFKDPDGNEFGLSSS